MLELPRSLETLIRAEGAKAYPDECCGILIGHLTYLDDGTPLRRVQDIRPIGNAREAAERYHRFVIKPLDYLQAETEAETAGLDLLGFYHSHPDHPARPSDYDREHAFPNLSYLVMSVSAGTTDLVTSWELSADRTLFSPEAILSPRPEAGRPVPHQGRILPPATNPS